MNTCVAVSWPLNLSTAIVREPLTVAPGISVMAVVGQMTEARAGAEAAIMPHHALYDHCSERSSFVLVVDSGQVQGLFTEHDVLRLVSQNIALDRLTIGEVMTPPQVTMRESVLSDAMAVFNLFQQYDTHYLLLVDEQEQFTGVITQYALRQLLKFGVSTVQQSSMFNGTLVAASSTLSDGPSQDTRQSSLIGICRTTVEGEIAYLNDRYCEILGLSAETMVSETWCWGIHANDRKRVLASKRTIDHSCQLEYQFQRSDGDIVWLHEHYMAERNEEGHVIGYVSTLADISDRKRSEAALIQSEAQKQAILTAIPDYLFRVDAYGVYREVVDHKSEITLFPENVNPLGLSMGDVLPAAVAARQQFYLEETLRTGQLKTYEQQFQVHGQVRHEEVRVIKSGDDEALFMVRDISDRKRAEQQLQSLIEGTAATIGQDFFPALVRHIAASLDVAYAVINELVDGQLCALASWAHGAPHAPIFYCPKSTPCERTLKQGMFYGESLRSEDFPGEINLAEMDVESYLGIALYDSQQNVMGNLCILHTQPIPMPYRAEQILQVFAARAAAELERQRAIVSLEQLNYALEVKVAERTA
ncbi:MAG: PAS domain S-box protein, partial [Cyanobacteria bacterium P01_D01_bin.56]